MRFVINSRAHLFGCLLVGGLLPAVSGCGRSLPSDVVANARQAEAIRAKVDEGGGGGSGTLVVSTGTPTGWGVLKGSFKLGGSSPERVLLTIDKDQEVCAPAGRKVYSEDLVVDASGGIRDVLIILSQAIPPDEPWTHPSMKPGKTEPAIFDQKECVFLTRVFVSQVTQTVVIKNSDPVGHNTNIKPRNNASYDQTIAAGGEAKYEPKKEEDQPAPVSCAIHPWMKANMVFRHNSYFAVTKADGSFEIPNLPSGVDLEFRVWQERAGFLSDVKVNNEDPKPRWSKGKFKLAKLNDNETRMLDVVVDAKALK